MYAMESFYKNQRLTNDLFCTRILLTHINFFDCFIHDFFLFVSGFEPMTFHREISLKTLSNWYSIRNGETKNRLLYLMPRKSIPMKCSSHILTSSKSFAWSFFHYVIFSHKNCAMVYNKSSLKICQRTFLNVEQCQLFLTGQTNISTFEMQILL